MSAKHAFTSAVPASSDATKIDGPKWNAQHLMPYSSYALLIGTTAVLTPAAASAAINTELYATVKPTRTRIDLTEVDEVRLQAVVIATGNAAGGAWKLSYNTTNPATWTGTDVGADVVLGTNGGAAGVVHTGSWTAVPVGAKGDVYIAVLVGVAMGTTPPTIGSLTLQYR